MKLYIAGSSADIALVRDLQQRACEAGHEITYDWTSTPVSPTHDAEERRRLVLEDLREGVDPCHVLWFVAPEAPSGKTEGGFFELGWALAKGKPCLVSGPHARRVDRVFTELAEIYETHHEALQALKHGVPGERCTRAPASEVVSHPDRRGVLDALKRTLAYATPEAIFRRPSGNPISTAEMIRMLETGDPDAMAFLDNVYGAAVRILRLEGDRRAQNDVPKPRSEGTKAARAIRDVLETIPKKGRATVPRLARFLMPLFRRLPKDVQTQLAKDTMLDLAAAHLLTKEHIGANGNARLDGDECQLGRVAPSGDFEILARGSTWVDAWAAWTARGEERPHGRSRRAP